MNLSFEQSYFFKYVINNSRVSIFTCVSTFNSFHLQCDAIQSNSIYSEPEQYNSRIHLARQRKEPRRYRNVLRTRAKKKTTSRWKDSYLSAFTTLLNGSKIASFFNISYCQSGPCFIYHRHIMRACTAREQRAACRACGATLWQ